MGAWKTGACRMGKDVIVVMEVGILIEVEWLLLGHGVMRKTYVVFSNIELLCSAKLFSSFFSY